MYTNSDKSKALRHLVVNLGDVDKTAEQTGVSKSTLHRWKKELKSYENVLFWEQDSKTRAIQSQYEGVRDKMLTQIQRLLERMDHYGPEYAPDYANAVVKLTDRIVKIEALLEMGGQYAITINLKGLLTSDQQDHAQSRLATPTDNPDG